MYVTGTHGPLLGICACTGGQLAWINITYISSFVRKVRVMHAKYTPLVLGTYFMNSMSTKFKTAPFISSRSNGSSGWNDQSFFPLFIYLGNFTEPQSQFFPPQHRTTASSLTLPNNISIDTIKHRILSCSRPRHNKESYLQSSTSAYTWSQEVHFALEWEPASTHSQITEQA